MRRAQQEATRLHQAQAQAELDAQYWYESAARDEYLGCERESSLEVPQATSPNDSEV